MVKSWEKSLFNCVFERTSLWCENKKFHGVDKKNKLLTINNIRETILYIKEFYIYIYKLNIYIIGN